MVKPELAVVYDDVYRPPAKDFLLGLDSEHKAEANARFHPRHHAGRDLRSPTRRPTNTQKSLALDPSNVELSIKIAWDYLRHGDTPGAINLLKETIKAAPKQARPRLALANIYFNNLNKVDVALKYTQQALDLDPANIACYEYLRDLYKATGQAQKVPALLDRAAKAETKDAMFWLRLGALYAEVFLADDPAKNADDLKKTTAIFQKALAFGNNEIEIIGKIADFFRRHAATRRGRPALQAHHRHRPGPECGARKPRPLLPRAQRTGQGRRDAGRPHQDSTRCSRTPTRRWRRFTRPPVRWKRRRRTTSKACSSARTNRRPMRVSRKRLLLLEESPSAR